MDGMYGYDDHNSRDHDNYSDKALMSPENLILPSDYYEALVHHNHNIHMFGSDSVISSEAASITPEDNNNNYNITTQRDDQEEEDGSTIIKAKIASHPSYPRLLDAYIACQKVGAPPEIGLLLDEIRRENEVRKLNSTATTIHVSSTNLLGADPELDEFMEIYCDMLLKYKSDLERPFGEATSFLNKVEMQLRNLCTGASIRTLSVDFPKFYHLRAVEGGASSEEEEELSGGEAEGQEEKSEDRDLKDMLLRRFGTHISSLKIEFSKKKKKGKLPKEARQTLLDWWNLHYKWPYPTEADKTFLADKTGLDQKQINNWFINQRKRHWKPSENMQLAVMDNLSGHFYPDE
ncbi:hypothetical protein ACFE04_022193 [Oxalis oulophora]